MGVLGTADANGLAVMAALDDQPTKARDGNCDGTAAFIALEDGTKRRAFNGGARRCRWWRTVEALALVEGGQMPVATPWLVLLSQGLLHPFLHQGIEGGVKTASRLGFSSLLLRLQVASDRFQAHIIHPFLHRPWQQPIHALSCHAGLQLAPFH